MNRSRSDGRRVHRKKFSAGLRWALLLVPTATLTIVGRTQYESHEALRSLLVLDAETRNDRLDRMEESLADAVRKASQEGVSASSGRDDAETLSIRGMLAGIEDRIEALERLLADNETISPVLAAEYNRLGMSAMEKGRPAEAVPLFEAAWHMDPGPCLYPLNYAKAIQDSSPPVFKISEIRRGLCTVLEKDPYNGEALHMAFDLAVEEGDVPTAIDCGISMAKVHPEDEELAWNLGRLLIWNGQPEQAVLYLRRAVEEMPDDAAPPAVLGQAYFDLGREADAENAFLLSLERAPDQFAALSGLGQLRFDQEMYDEAVRFWTKAAEVRPTPAILENLGQAHSWAGDAESAVTAWRQAISRTNLHTQQDLDHVAGLYADIAEEHLRGGSFDEALESVRKGMSVGHTSRLLSLEERVLAECGDSDASKSFEGVARRHPGSAEANRAGRIPEGNR